MQTMSAASALLFMWVGMVFVVGSLWVTAASIFSSREISGGGGITLVLTLASGITIVWVAAQRLF